MSSLLAHGKEYLGKYGDVRSCSNCRKVFSHNQGLVGEHRFHRMEMNSKRCCHPCCSFNFAAIIVPNPYHFARTPPESCSGVCGIMGPFFNREAPPFSCCRSFCSCSCENSLGNTGSLGSSESHLSSCPNLSVSKGCAEIHSYNRISSRGIASSKMSRISNAFAPHTTAKFPSGPSLSSDSKETYQLSTNRFRTCRDSLPFPSGDNLQNPEWHAAHTELPHSSCSVIHCHPVHDVNQSPGSENSVFLPQGPCSCVGQIEGSQSTKESAFSFEKSKRPFSGDVPVAAESTGASKRQKTGFFPAVQSETPQNKELLLFKHDSFPGSDITIGSAIGGEGDPDLSLHL